MGPHVVCHRVHASYDIQLEQGFTGHFEIPADQMQERGAEAIGLRGDSGVFLSGEGTIDEALGSIEQIGFRES